MAAYKAMHIMQVGARHSYTSLRGFFYGWSDIDGDLLPLPHPTNDLNSDKLRVSPPNAAWYTVTRKPVFTGKNPQPLDWNDADCKKNLADHKKILMDACYTGGIRDEWQRKVIMAIAMLVSVLHCALDVRLHASKSIDTLLPFAALRQRAFSVSKKGIRTLATSHAFACTGD